MHGQLFGDRAILVTGIEHPLACVSVLADRFGDAQVRVGMDSVLVEFTDPRRDLVELLEQAERVIASAPQVQAGNPREVLLPMRYDGMDLAAAAHELGMESKELIRVHQEAVWQVAMIGFAPGFPYLVPVGEQGWQVPRLATPRARVPAGSVAIAAGLCAIYPTAMPGGWNVIGSTEVRLFDAEAERPALLAPGDVVRFVEAS